MLTLWAPFALSGRKFKPVQVHFHWGGQDDIGSEHTVNGSQYAAEVHGRLLPNILMLIIKFVVKEKSERKNLKKNHSSRPEIINEMIYLITFRCFSDSFSAIFLTFREILRNYKLNYYMATVNSLTILFSAFFYHCSIKIALPFGSICNQVKIKRTSLAT